MAITKLYNGKYQVKVVGSDGKWVTQCFPSRREAAKFEGTLRQQKTSGKIVLSQNQSMTLNEFFVEWYAGREGHASSGWRKEQLRLYRGYVEKAVGGVKLQAVTPQMVANILTEMAQKGRAPQTRLHVFTLLRKMYGDAIEIYQRTHYNPVIRKLKPKLVFKESPHLNLVQAKALLEHVWGKPYGLGIWLQLYLGLRVGELQALTWDDVDLERGTVRIHRSYVRKSREFKDHPKGRRQHTKRLPNELIDALKMEKEKSTCPYIATVDGVNMLCYEWYCRRLKRYCRELKIPAIGTHGLRHTTSELYLTYGATRDDLRQLFALSSMSVTDRYVHGRGSNLEKVSNVIKLFPTGLSKKFPNEAPEAALVRKVESGVSKKFPKS